MPTSVSATVQPIEHWSRRLDFPLMRRRPTVTWQELDGEAVLHDITTGGTHHLNGTAHLVWKSLDGERDATSIAADMAAQFAVCVHTAQSDVEELLVILADAGLIEEADA
jgi:hypothetical protein